MRGGGDQNGFGAFTLSLGGQHLRISGENLKVEIAETNHDKQITAGPHLSAVSGGEPSTPSFDADGAKMGCLSTPDRPDAQSDIANVESKRAVNNSHSVEPVTLAGATEPAGAVASHAAPVNNSRADGGAEILMVHRDIRTEPQPLSKTESILKLRPFCKNPEHCGGYGRECSCKRQSEAA